MRSRDIARKAKKCMEKISNCSVSNQSTSITPDASSDCELAEIVDPMDVDQNQPHSSTETDSISKSQSAPTASISESQSAPKDDCTITRVTMSTRKGFSHQEDLCIKKGIKKHGWGQWALILRDPDFNFNVNRGTNTLQRRAVLLKQRGFTTV